MLKSPPAELPGLAETGTKLALYAWTSLPIAKPKLVLAVEALVKSDKLLDFTSFSPKDVVIVVEKLESSPKAAASSFKVLIPGAESTRSETLLST